MNILAFDGTAKAASVAVLKDEKALAVYTIDNGLTQSELLLPMAEDVLKSLGMSFNDIELFATSVGPGSFTGVRIGVSLVKGLAFGTSVPCAAVSTLEAIMENIRGLCGILVPVMDARRNQVYTAIFSSDENGVKRMSDDMALPITELAEMLKKYEDRPIYLAGDGYEVAKKQLTSLGVKCEDTPYLLRNENAYSVGLAALRMHKAGIVTNDLDIAPTYLRMPQAERERLEKEGKL